MKSMATTADLWLCTAMILANVSEEKWAKVVWMIFALFWCVAGLIEERRWRS